MTDNLWTGPKGRGGRLELDATEHALVVERIAAARRKLADAKISRGNHGQDRRR